ncbi:MAG: pyridoxal kinase [Rhizobiales bacterium]|nr:pyridoxal kinase [Hyphomicrobiales bacterium]
MARILAVSSQVVYGPVGLTAAVPALQAMGHEVLALPTVQLSNHPGLGKPVGHATPASEMSAMLEALERIDALQALDAVMTGYFANADQAEVMAKWIAKLCRIDPAIYVLVDPVIGDDDALYVSEALAISIRDRLVPLATCITPNAFELGWLTKRVVKDSESAIAAARSLAAPEVLATSVPDGAMLANIIVASSSSHRVTSPKLMDVPHGTGDLLAGLYLAHRFGSTPEDALNRAVPILSRTITASLGGDTLAIAEALHGS